jgi:AraC family transcriptional regulator of adaptative response/methylated-DNA-[protein]-cysteine methyltransferase
MMFDLPDHQTLYTALVTRDPSYEGRAFVVVRTTGIFCRLVCPARNPNSENCQFYPSVAECITAGFRPCKRCHPISSTPGGEPVVTQLLAALEADPTRRWSETDVAQMGLDPSTVRRAFKRQLGLTFLDLARQRRLQEGFSTLSDGGRLIDAQLDSGFSSASGFRAAFARLLGKSPGQFTGHELMRADCITTDLGTMIAVSDKDRLHLLEFADRRALPQELKSLQGATPGGIGLGRFAPIDQVTGELAAYLNGTDPTFRTPLAMHASAFTRAVWDALHDIPVGTVQTYGQIALRLGRPTAVRAVARANGANQIAILIPCHRVIGADGSLTGYGGGLWRKRRLIDLETEYRLKNEER